MTFIISSDRWLCIRTTQKIDAGMLRGKTTVKTQLQYGKLRRPSACWSWQWEQQFLGRREIRQPSLLSASRLLFQPPSETRSAHRGREGGKKRRSHVKSFVPISRGRENKYFAFIWPVLVMWMTSLNWSAEARVRLGSVRQTLQFYCK